MSASRAQVLLLAIGCLAASPVPRADAAPIPPETIFTTADAIQRLSREEADQKLPVQIRAVVTFSHPESRQMFVEDQTSGIYCEAGLLTQVPEPGQQVELSGVTSAGSYLSIIKVKSVRLLDPAPFPQARPATLSELWDGKFDADLVRVSGYITHSQVQTNPGPATTLHIISDGLTAYVRIPSLTTFALNELPGRHVEVTGVFGPTVNRRQVTSVGILAARQDFVQVGDPGNDILASLQPVSIRTALTMTNQLARVRGSVMLVGGSDQGFWICDGANGLNVYPASQLSVQRGEIVELAGKVRANNREIGLTPYRLVSRTNGPPLIPTAVNTADLVDPARYGQLVTVQGEYVHKVANTNGDLLVMRDGERTFEARIRHGDGTAPEKLTPGTILSVTGVLRLPHRNPPRVLISSESDLHVVMAAPWPLRYTLMVVTVLAFLLTGGLASLGVAYHRLRAANARVHQADRELRDLNTDLEKRIRLRTAELESANLQLNADITERKRHEVALRESEERFATAFHSSPAIIAITTFPDGQIIDANQRMVELSGYTREEIIGRTTIDLGMWANPRQRDDLLRLLSTGGENGGPCQFVRDFEFEGINRSGRRFILLTSIDRIELAGKPCMLSIIQDITERKQAEDSLRESEERFAKAFHASPALILIERQSDSTCTDVNSRFAEVIGYTREEIIGRTALDLGLWINPARRHYIIDGVHAGLQVRDFECSIRNKAGERLTMLISVERIVLGGELCLLSIYHDITARKQAEELRDGQTQVLEMIAQGAPLEETLERLVRVIEAQSEGLLCSIQWIDGDGERVYRGAAPSLPPEFHLKAGGILVGPGAGSNGPPAQRLETIVVEDIASDPTWASECNVALAAGLRSCWSSPIFDAQRRLLGTFAIFSRKPGRPTERQLKLIETATHTAAICILRAQTEEALRCSEERFQYAMRGANDGLWDWNLLTNEVYYSPRWKSMLGYEPGELAGHINTWKQLVHPDDLSNTLAAVREIFAKGLAMYQAEFRMRHKQGAWVNILSRGFVVHDVHGTPVRMVGTHLDITERKRAEEARASLEVQLRQSQKMEAIGTLAGGIAHDFNNILGVIIGYTELVLRDLPDNPHTRGSLEHVLKASHRAKELVRQILQFSRNEEFQRTHLRLDAVLTETIALLRATLPASIEITPHIVPPVPAVSGNQTLIQQVLVNLASNAAQAIGRQPGQIAITIEGWQVDETSPERGRNLRPGLYARLTVRDSGPGIDAAIIDRIFEPFFTTKGPGEGTGLGLSVVHGIVQSHDGAIRVNSRPGLGSTFEVYLPATAEESPPPWPDQPDILPVRGSERILLVDDEASLLKIGERFLRESGYEVTTCLHPDTALELFRHSPWNFDLVITDYSMPGQSGLDLGARIRELRQDLPMIICTGYGAGLTKERARRVGFHNVLHKPVGLEEFGQAIREALEQTVRQA